MFRHLAQCALALALAPAAHAGTSYHLVDLGPNTQADAVNAAGQVAGQRPDGFAGVYQDGAWSGPDPHGRDSVAQAIDDRGNLAGFEDGQFKPSATWYPHGRKRVVIAMPADADFAWARALSPDGSQLAGSYFGTEGSDHCFVWNPAVGGTAAELPRPSGTFNCEAYAINDRGEIAGSYALEPTDRDQGFVYTHGNFRPVGTLPGDPSANSRMLAINAKGHAAGWSSVETPFGTRSHAVMWDGQVLTDLGADMGGAGSVAVAINDKDEVLVAAASGTGASEIYVFRDGKRAEVMRRIDDLSGWAPYSFNPTGIDSAGVIVGYGYRDDDTQGGRSWHGFMLVPVVR